MVAELSLVAYISVLPNGGIWFFSLFHDQSQIWLSLLENDVVNETLVEKEQREEPQNFVSITLRLLFFFCTFVCFL